MVLSNSVFPTKTAGNLREKLGVMCWRHSRKRSSQALLLWIPSKLQLSEDLNPLRLNLNHSWTTHGRLKCQRIEGQCEKTVALETLRFRKSLSCTVDGVGLRIQLRLVVLSHYLRWVWCIHTKVSQKGCMKPSSNFGCFWSFRKQIPRKHFF